MLLYELSFRISMQLTDKATWFSAIRLSIMCPVRQLSCLILYLIRLAEWSVWLFFIKISAYMPFKQIYPCKLSCTPCHSNVALYKLLWYWGLSGDSHHIYIIVFPMSIFPCIDSLKKSLTNQWWHNTPWYTYMKTAVQNIQDYATFRQALIYKNVHVHCRETCLLDIYAFSLQVRRHNTLRDN